MNKKSDRLLVISFTSDKDFTVDVFEDGICDGIQRPVQVYFDVPKLDYLPEGSFKSILDQNQENRIKIFHILSSTNNRLFRLQKLLVD